jgi:hypothetical protein
VATVARVPKDEDEELINHETAEENPDKLLESETPEKDSDHEE